MYSKRHHFSRDRVLAFYVAFPRVDGIIWEGDWLVYAKHFSASFQCRSQNVNMPNMMNAKMLSLLTLCILLYMCISRTEICIFG